jgi:hypothetical protein
MTSCPLSLKAIPAHNSSQRDIKHPLEGMSAKIVLREKKGRKMERKREEEKEKKKKRRRKREEEKEYKSCIILWGEELFGSQGIKRRNAWALRNNIH